jgi:hypothetical protein
MSAAYPEPAMAIPSPTIVPGNKLVEGRKYRFEPKSEKITIEKITQMHPQEYKPDIVSSGEGIFSFSSPEEIIEKATGGVKFGAMKYYFNNTDKVLSYIITDNSSGNPAYFEDKGMAGGRRRRRFSRRRSTRRRSNRH